MATGTPIVLILSRDSGVKHVTATLHADGLSARTASSARELQRALSSSKLPSVRMSPSTPASQLVRLSSPCASRR
jgi:hypothetical protein